MKTIDPDHIESIPGRQLKPDDTFSFRCHSGLDCFNQCCRNLNLFLYPYDVLRLRNRIGITSDQFLDRYSDIVLRPSGFFPEVLLRMADNSEKTCPYLTSSGCSVYPDRPDTCRSFPVENGLLFDAATKSTRPVYFFRPPDFCQGQYESDIWTPKTWAQDQEAITYNKWTARWAEIRGRFQLNPYGNEKPDGPKGKMTFMAAYNIDRFREFVFESSFLKRYKVKNAVLKKMKAEDEALLLFAFDWINFFLWGIKTKQFHLR